MAVQFDLRHLPHHDTEHGLRIKSICKVCPSALTGSPPSHSQQAAVLLVDPSRKTEKSDVVPQQPSDNGNGAPMNPSTKVRTIPTLGSIKKDEFIRKYPQESPHDGLSSPSHPSFPHFQLRSIRQTSSIDSISLTVPDAAKLFPALQTLAPSSLTR